ncbi:MAG: leucyl aminopeptidase [Chloroflexi bacterium]|nr:leucyl aminopeptidase [Chloroflexota bacterium]
MEIRTLAADITRVEVGALIVNLFEGVTQPGGATGAVDQALGGAISQLIADGETKGKKGAMTLIHTFGRIGPARVLVAGLGKREQFDADVVRQVTGEACRYLHRVGVQRVATIAHGAGIGGLGAEESGQAIAEGALLGLYAFKRHISSNSQDNEKEIQELLVVEQDQAKVAALAQGIERGRIVAEGATLARDLVNEPANIMTPTRMAEVARQVAQEGGLECQVLEREQMQELGMGALLAVAAGSAQPPKLIILKYNGDPQHPENNLGIIGKGITFDSGGISIKPAQSMWEMKGDMSGGASVIGTLQAISRLKPKINVIGVVPATENMPGGSAQRPGDIVKAMNGKSIEVDNTDAEGRMVLVDAMCYAREKQGVRRMVDIATLTGAMVVALGNGCTGALGTDQPLVDRVLRASTAAGEKMWQLPLLEEYKEQNKSTWADVKNSGGRGAGGITAALFLSEFAGDIPWVHLDIAGTFLSDKEKGYIVKGATGVPVRTLANLALDLAGR